MAHSRRGERGAFPGDGRSGSGALAALYRKGILWVAGAVVPLAILLALFAGAWLEPGWARSSLPECKGRAASRAGHRRELRFLYSVHAVAGSADAPI